MTLHIDMTECRSVRRTQRFSTLSR